MKRIFATILSLVLALTVITGFDATAFAATSSKKPVIESVKYEGNGKVEVEFTSDVKFKSSATVTVTKKSNDKTYTATILEKDDDSIEFKSSSYTAGASYSFKITGIKLVSANSYTTVSGTFKVPAAGKIGISHVEYDGSGKVEVEFSKDVTFKSSAKVTVTNSSGKEYSATILDLDDDSIEFRSSVYSAGKTYTFKITGIKLRTASSYTTVSGTFTVPSAKKLSIEKVEYDGYGRVEVEFVNNVTLKSSAKITAKDSSGNTYSTTILDYDHDGIEFKINSYKTGRTYTFTISGIKSEGASSYTTISGTVKIPSNALAIKSVEYDAEDYELCIEFNKSVTYGSNLKVTVTDSKGNTYRTTILEKEYDEIELWVIGLTEGDTYTVKVENVKVSGGSSYTTLTKTFKAIDD